MWLLAAALIFLLALADGFPEGNWRTNGNEGSKLVTGNNGQEILSPAYLTPMQFILWRRKRGPGEYREKPVESSWDERQRGIKEIKDLEELRGVDAKDQNGYNSILMKWNSNWRLGPIEKRKYLLDIDPRSRFSYPLSKQLLGRSNHHNAGYYKALDVAGIS